MCQAEVLSSLHIPAVWRESSLGTFWIAKVAKFVHVTTKTDQTVRMSEGTFFRVVVYLYYYFERYFRMLTHLFLFTDLWNEEL